jgi:hypothetical protein
VSNNDQSDQVMDDIDPRFLELIHNKVNSFIKWDIVRFFHDNPHTTDTADGIARYTGRDILIVEPELEQLAKSGVLETTELGEMLVYTLTADAAMRDLIHGFVLACNSRQFRVKAIYHVIQGMR